MNMMRFILDCLRPARARAAAAARDTELQAGIKDTSGDNEIKGLKDEVHIEQETLQTTKAVCRNTQETVEKLEERKTLLKEELEMIYNLQKQEREVLQSLQEEQQELEQTLQQYDRELCAAAEDLLQLQREVAYAKTHAESLHVRISPLQDIYEEIVQVKKKLSELVAGLITGESAMTEMTEEDHCGVLVGKTDDVESECDQVYSESILSDEKEEETDHVELESTIEELDKMQRSLENLKSSGSSSFTEITLTEVKEEDVMFRSTTPQSDSSDMEKEDFEIIQPTQATNKQFDFYHPNPFTEGDVFGDDHFPKVDVTEQLPRDPFKGTDPFASDSLLVDMTKEEHCDDGFITAENNDNLHYPFQSAGKDYGTFNAPINKPLGADFKRSAASMSTGLKSYPDADSEIGTNAEQAVSEESSHSSTMSNSFDADPSMFAEEDRFGSSFIKGPNSLCGLQSIIAGSYTGFPLSPCDPEPVSGISDIQKIFERHITSEQNAVNDKDSCHSELPAPIVIDSNTSNDTQPSPVDVYDYKYGDMFFFTVRLDPGSPEPHNHSPGCPEPTDIRKDESPDQLDADLSPEINDMDEFDCCSTQPEDTDQHSQIINAHNHSPGYPEPTDIRKDESPDQLDADLSPEINDMDEFDCCSTQPEDTDQHSQIINAHNHSPGYPEPTDIRKDESPDQLDADLSPEINDMDEFDCCSTQPEDTDQHSQIINAHNHSPGYPEPTDIRKDESPDQLDADLSPEINDMDEFDCCSTQPEDTEQHSQIVCAHNHSPGYLEPIDIRKDESPDQLDATLSPESNDMDELDCCSPIIINGQGCFDNGEPDNAANSDPVGNAIFESDCDRVEVPIPCLPFEDSKASQSEDNSEWDDEAYPTADNKSTVQDLLCLFSNTDASSSDLIPESSCSQQNKLESVAMSKYELQYFDPFSPIPSDLEEMNTANSFCHEAPRLDSGYHEVGTPTPFSPEPTDKSKYSIDLQGPGLTTSKQSDSEIHVADPFSPESVDTGIFDSETENCESSYMIMKSQFFSPQLVDMDSNNAEEKQINNVSCDILSDHLSGSEPDDCFPFGSCPSNEESYAYSSEEIPGNGSDGEFKPGSNAGNSSEVIRCGSVWRNSEMGLPNPDVFDTIFDFDTTADGSFVPNINQNEEAPHAEKVVKKADLVEIDYFCSELSKMVSSSSSDSVQQSVAEMLFGSEPNTSSFYPWDFEKQQQNC